MKEAHWFKNLHIKKQKHMQNVRKRNQAIVLPCPHPHPPLTHLILSPLAFPLPMTSIVLQNRRDNLWPFIVLKL